MHQKLIIKTFKKIKDEEEKATGIKPSDTATAKLLSDYIFENQKLSFGERRLADYYRMAKKQESGKVIIKDPRIVQAMCGYLEHESFSDFKKAHGIIDTKTSTNNSTKVNVITFFKKHKVSMIISSTIIIIMLITYSANKQRWMVWENDRYIEVSFDPEKYNLDQLKLFNEDRVKNFRKVNVDCDTEFFDISGKVKIWYGKNIKKELEFFTSLGLHPETGKTLDPITDYMIEKYVCPKKTL
ncbi:hypothetical protein [Mesoflavibacter zeaxanthinifaciens]|uniref:hypothetical protein n=1 Tax=Mesoflavibacter zeaxanthinifaciens TaxID=393060 RepID=UPI003A955C8B